MPIRDDPVLRIPNPGVGSPEMVVKETKFVLRPLGSSSAELNEDGDEEEYFTGKNVRQRLVYMDSGYQVGTRAVP